MIEKIPHEFGSKFRFILVAAERAKHLQNGAPPKVSIRSRKPARIAIEELRSGVVEWELLEEVPEE